MLIMLGIIACALGAAGMYFYGGGTEASPLKSFHYAHGGGMRGGYSFTSVKALDKNYALVASGGKKWHNEDLEVKEYKVSVGFLEELHGIYNKHRLGRCAKALKSPFTALDKDTSRYSFSFEKVDVTFNSEQMLPSGTNEALKELFTKIKDSCDKGERLPSLVQEAAKNNPDKLSKQIVKGKLLWVASSYQGKVLETSFLNGLGERKLVNTSYKLIKADENNRVVEENNNNKTLKMIPYSHKEHSIEFRERLQAGKYVLKLDEFELKFEMK